MKIYIAGPMTGIPHYNFPAFDKATEMLRSRGHDVSSPADMDRTAGFDAMDLPEDSDWGFIPEGFDIDACLVRDIDAIRWSDAVYLLPGWEDSVGCKMEKAVAEFLRKKIIFAGEPGDLLFDPFPKGQTTETLPCLVNAEGTPVAQAVMRDGEPVFWDTSQAPMPGPLPENSAERKTYPLSTGLMRYFPRALAAVAHHSYVNNEKHNPSEPVHWSRGKSDDHADCLLRHMLDGDLVAVAWRALAQLEIALEGAAEEKRT